MEPSRGQGQPHQCTPQSYATHFNDSMKYTNIDNENLEFFTWNRNEKKKKTKEIYLCRYFLCIFHEFQ